MTQYTEIRLFAHLLAYIAGREAHFGRSRCPLTGSIVNDQKMREQALAVDGLMNVEFVDHNILSALCCTLVSLHLPDSALATRVTAKMIENRRYLFPDSTPSSSGLHLICRPARNAVPNAMSKRRAEDAIQCRGKFNHRKPGRAALRSPARSMPAPRPSTAPATPPSPPRPAPETSPAPPRPPWHRTPPAPPRRPPSG